MEAGRPLQEISFQFHQFLRPTACHKAERQASLRHKTLTTMCADGGTSHLPQSKHTFKTDLQALPSLLHAEAAAHALSTGKLWDTKKRQSRHARSSQSGPDKMRKRPCLQKVQLRSIHDSARACSSLVWPACPSSDSGGKSAENSATC